MKSLDLTLFAWMVILATIWLLPAKKSILADAVGPNQQAEMIDVREDQALLRGAPLDLNQASSVELQTLPGIGPKLAGEIVRNREKKGPFRSVDSLQRVRGIGPKSLQKIRPLVVVSR